MTNPPAPTAVIWDLDGTLVDSERLHFETWQEVMQGCGIDYSEAEFLADFGKTTPAVLREYLGPDLPAVELNRLTLLKATLFRDRAPTELKLLPGAGEWLEAIADEGLLQAVASSAPMQSIAAVIRDLDLGQYFAALLSGVALPRSKPDPALFLNAAGAMGQAARDCLVMEDSNYGIEAARRAGMPSVAVGERAAEAAATLADSHGAIPCLQVPDMTRTSWHTARMRLAIKLAGPA